MDRFFHIRATGNCKGGATVFVRDALNGFVHVSVAYCSPDDNFCRRDGRDIARNKMYEEKFGNVPLEHLPKKLLRVQREVIARCTGLSRTKREKHPLWNYDFSFATKYFGPKKDDHGGGGSGGAPTGRVVAVGRHGVLATVHH